MAIIRVLHMLHGMKRGGAENALMNYYRHIDRSKVQFDFLVTASEKCPFDDEIKQMGGRIYHVPLLTMKNPLPYLRGVKSFFLAHPEYKIVHSHTSSKSVFPLWMAKQANVPVRISHSHSSMAEPGLTGWIRKRLKPFLKLVVTDRLSCGIQAGNYLYGEGARYMVFRNVIECEKYCLNGNKRKEIRASLGLCDEDFVIGHTARFHPVKNHKFDVEILAELKKIYPKSKFLEVGLGVKEGISEYAQKLGVLDSIIFTGVVNNVCDYEQAMDVFILPSFNEGLPLSIIEAQVSGLPCFTTTGKVSSECSVTDLVKYLPLEAGAKVWAEAIYKARTIMRKDRFDELSKVGYDAETSAKELQNFYIKRYKEVSND